MRRTRVWGALSGACPTLACNFRWSSFRLNGYDRTLDHAEESLLNSFSTYVTGAVSTTATSSCDLVNFINIHDAHAMTT
jgi:hypothetical protein